MAVRVKAEPEARDGGWPAEYQHLRRQPFDRARYADLHAHFFRPDARRCN